MLRESLPDAPHDVARLDSVFGWIGMIYLQRSDLGAQAGSLETARRAGSWHRHADDTLLEELAPQDALVFDCAAIAARVETLAGCRAL